MEKIFGRASPPGFWIFLVAFLVSAIPGRSAAVSASGTISGSVLESTNDAPVEFATVELRQAGEGRPREKATTDRHGHFVLKNVPAGDYLVVVRAAGSDRQASRPVTVSADYPIRELGPLKLAEPAVALEKFEVTAKKETFFNSIDRKVYNVGREIQGSAGTASDLLQNIPSVQVDLDGNVSLRGNENVLILVNGKPSPEMSAKNRADTLSLLSADSIESIEVITNPSARFQAEGTAGIINLVEKRKRDPGYSGTIRLNAGNNRRLNGGLTANYHPGKLNVFGSVTVRQDERVRTTDEARSHLDPASGVFVGTRQTSAERMRPLTRLLQAGADYEIGPGDRLGAAVSFNDRTFFRTSTIKNLSTDGDGQVTSDYDRLRADHEWQKTVGLSANYEHDFEAPGRNLKLELRRDRHWEQEDNHYTNLYRIPATLPSSDYTLIRPLELGTTLTADYVHPFADGAKLEAGYAGEWDLDDADFRGGDFDPVTGLAIPDVARTNHFIYRDTIHALYATVGRSFGAFSAQGGLRAEHDLVDTDQVSLAERSGRSSGRLHPSLHLAYDLTSTDQLQLNYSHRIHRPEGEDLNPFPEYQDPFNLREGNPQLRPEETDSVEAGYQYHRDSTSYLGTLYYRETHDAFTTVTRYIDPTTLLTTEENLASNRSGGLELATTAPVGPQVSANLSANLFYNEVDASNLGYASRRSAIAWSGKLNLDWRASRSDLVQFTSNYRARQLTAQGERLPAFVANLGFRHDFRKRNTALVLTVSDLFHSLSERTVIDTPVLHDRLLRRRSSRFFYIGFVYNFGKVGKSPKDDAIKVDDSI